jgi:hypothetical protein
MSKKYNEIPAKNNMDVNKDEEETVPKEKKEMKKIVDSQPKKIKRGLLSRLAVGMLGPEGLPSIGTYINEEIIKPAIKNIIVDAVTSGINRLIYGDSRPRTGGHSTGYYRDKAPYRPNTNYTSRYTSSNQEPRERVATPYASSRYGVDEYIIEERYDAARVLTTLTENAEVYGSVSVADYYDLIGVATRYTDNTYGWTMESITQASIVPIRGGYVIKFPPVEVI